MRKVCMRGIKYEFKHLIFYFYFPISSLRPHSNNVLLLNMLLKDELINKAFNYNLKLI